MRGKKRLKTGEYVNGILSGDKVVLGRAITLVESTLGPDQEIADEVIKKILPYAGNSIRVGITGAPGVGKSTFIEVFGKTLLDRGHRIAILAIDPSSRRSRGSILGDKTRMEGLVRRDGVFIRPSPASDTLGGVSAKTREVMLLCEAAGYNVVLVETVGVGQSEMMVKEMVDFFLLLMLAGAGDELQGIKRGIVEMADALLITKADGENSHKAKQAEREYGRALHLLSAREDKWIPRVGHCSALTGEGVEGAWRMIEEFTDKMKATGFFEKNRKRQRLSWFEEQVNYFLRTGFYLDKRVRDKMDCLLLGVENGEVSPLAAARKLVKEFLKGN